jgi:hypothetical protein
VSRDSFEVLLWLTAMLAAGTVYCFYYGFRAWHRNRAVGDTPTSRLRSAAQGYVELSGRGLLPEGVKNGAPLTDLPCAWWRFKIEKRTSDDWTTLDHGISVALFILDDGTGQCLVDPDGAEVYPSAVNVWYGSEEWPSRLTPRRGGKTVQLLSGQLMSGKYRYTEERLLVGERLSVLGSFRTRGNAAADEAERAIAELLREWKQDQASLLARFDADRDGVISMAEWDRAREAARAQITADMIARPSSPAINVLSKPQDGRAFLLAAADAQALARGLRWRAAAGVTGFVGGASGLTWVLAHLW